MTGYIVGAGELSKGELALLLSKKEATDLLLVADGGYDALSQSSEAVALIDYMIGDMDSVRTVFDYQSLPMTEHVNAAGDCYRIYGDRYVIFAAEKNDTDVMAAVRFGIEKGVDSFVLLGGLGGSRMEHTLGNLLIGAWIKRQRYDVTIYGQNRMITYLGSGECYELPKTLTPGNYVNVLSVADQSTGLTIEGLKYEVQNATLTNDSILGMSNEVTTSAGKIYLLTGLLVIIMEL